jgi:membrane fusion protein, multidrug efflux system
MIQKLSSAASWSVAVLAVLVTSCSRGGSTEQSPGGNRGGRALQAIPVAAVEVRPRDLLRTVTVTGPIEPIRRVSVSAQTTGTVLNVRVEEGNRVRAGDLMAELDSREASAQMERAQAVLANAKASFERAQKLEASDLTSAADLDAVRSSFEIAQADVELWRTRLAFCRITAPVSGVVTAKDVERGSSVSTNKVMFEIADDSLLVVRVRVSELDIVQLEPGRRVSLQLDAYPGVQLDGHIRRIFPSADPASRLVPVEVVLDGTPPGVDARPGFLARVEFTLDRRTDVLAVPAAAVGVSDSEAFVYVVDADTLVRKPVVTGLTASGWIEVKHGLEPGARVVSSGHVNLREGAPVRVTGGDSPTGETR